MTFCPEFLLEIGIKSQTNENCRNVSMTKRQKKIDSFKTGLDNFRASFCFFCFDFDSPDLRTGNDKS